MKNVLIVTLEFPPQIGGIATYIHDMANALPAASVTVLAPAMASANEWDVKQPYAVVRRSFFYPALVWPRWLRLLWHVKEIVKKKHIDVLLIHHALPVGYIGVLMKRFFHVPFLLFSHGTDIVSGTTTPWKKKQFVRVCRAAEQIIFNSESLKRRFLEKVPEFSNKSLVVYPCPESSFFTPPDHAFLDELRHKYALLGKKVIVSASRLVDGKGFPHLIRILPLILKEEPNLVWFIVGDGEKRESLMTQIQAHNLQNVVRFVGAVPHADMKSFLYLADIFVLLTHPDEGKEEGLGLVFLEAAAAGVAVVAGRSGGVTEAVDDGVTGRVVDVHLGDQRLADTIVELLRNEQEHTLMGLAGKERMHKEFVWEVQLKKIDSWLTL